VIQDCDESYSQVDVQTYQQLKGTCWRHLWDRRLSHVNYGCGK